MYTKLMLRGLLRHRKKGKRLFILLALCSATVIFLMTFRPEFTQRYRDLYIGTTSGHLQILPPESQVFAKNPFGNRIEDLPLYSLDPGLISFIRNLPEVEVASPVIELWGNSFNLDSEYEDGLRITALDPDILEKLFPEARQLEGSLDLSWQEDFQDVPFIRNRLYTEYGQKNPDHTKISGEDLKTSGEGLQTFKGTLSDDFPQLFPPGTFDTPEQDQVFFDHWTKLLENPELYKLLNADNREPYDYKVDDAVVALKENTRSNQWVFLNKRLFLALFPHMLAPVRERIEPGKILTLQVPPARTQGVISNPVIIPIKYTGMVDFMPLYSAGSFMNIRSLQYYMGLEETQVMGVTIRLKNINEAPRVQELLEAWIADHRLNLKVADYHLLGKLPMSTALAFDIIIGLLIGIFIVILIIFVVNLVLLSIIQRRKEIGTTTALGLSSGQTILIMVGEVLVIVGVSWAAGALLASIAVGATALWGLPGMIFFPGGKMFMGFHPEAYLFSFLLFLFIALISALIPLSGLRKLLPVDLLKEAN